MGNVKKSIGFDGPSMCEGKKCSCKSDESSQPDGNGPIPEHVVNEIENHVAAKYEFEQSMNKLAMFERGVRIGAWSSLIIVVIGLVIASFFYGRYYERQECIARCNTERMIYNAYYTGLTQGKAVHKKAMPNKNKRDKRSHKEHK